MDAKSKDGKEIMINYDNNNDVTILNFVILFANNYIYNCEKSGKPIDFYNFQMNLKTRMIID